MWTFRRKRFWNDRHDGDDNMPVPRRGCDVPGCVHLGDFKAPKSRYNLRDYYWFCIDHVREYNSNWDFFKGMTPGEVEHHLQKTMVWDRPTWRSTLVGMTDTDRARQRAYEQFASGESVFAEFAATGEHEPKKEAHIDLGSIPHPTLEALAVLGLAPPVQWDDIRARYKNLAKKYHPDTNKDKDAEELLKKINLAYTILKLSYQHYTTLDEKS